MSYDRKAHSEYLEEKAVADLNGGYVLEKPAFSPKNKPLCDELVCTEDSAWFAEHGPDNPEVP